MIRNARRLEEFERWYAAEHAPTRSYAEALEVFAALWRHAAQLRPDFPTDWHEDIAADIELARVLNGLDRR